jgi:hypothetical protein
VWPRRHDAAACLTGRTIRVSIGKWLTGPTTIAAMPGVAEALQFTPGSTHDPYLNDGVPPRAGDAKLFLRDGRASRARPCEPTHRHQSLPSLSLHRCISVFEGSDLSSTFFAVSIPAEGTSLASSRPSCTSTDA